MPIEMKKTLLKTSRKGRMSATIWWLYSDSERTSPAMNAPKASDRPNCASEPRGAEADQDHKDDEDFGASKPDDMIKRARHEYPRREYYRRDCPEAPCRASENIRDGRAFLAAEDGNQQHHRDNAKVLKEQDADGRTAVRRVYFRAFHIGLEHDCRARKREEKAEEDRTG